MDKEIKKIEEEAKKPLDLNKHFSEFNENAKIFQKVEIKLPQSNRLVSDFAEDMGNILSKKKIFYYKTDEKEVVEIRKIKHEGGLEEESYIGFKILQPERFVSLVERYVIPYKNVLTKFGYQKTITSMNKNQAALVLKSQQFEEKLPQIKRLFTIPIPILYDGELTFPKKGYDDRFNSWLPLNSLDIDKNMKLEDAKKIIEDIYSEFCFETDEDKNNAITGLITPFLRGLYPHFNDRTPLFFYIANRERAGKDYCAGITGLIYEGAAIEEPPVSTGNVDRGNNDELRKKILSIFMAGRKRLHFSNNRGFINNAILEQLITNKFYSDRLLGKNEVLKFENELELSLSGNMGVTFTGDLANRCKFIRLKLNIEDPNSRHFNKPDLHFWVLQNRAKIISALYSLVSNWVKKDMPNGSVPFNSFPEWAKICGGVMEAAGYENPCNQKGKQLGLSIGGDAETDGMKKFFEYMYEHHKDEPFKKKEMINIIESIGLQAEGILSYLDFNKNGDKAKFGLLIEKFVDRILSGIVLIRVTNKEKSSYLQEYSFKEYFEEKNIKVENNLDKNQGSKDKKLKNSSIGNRGGVEKCNTSPVEMKVIEDYPQNFGVIRLNNTILGLIRIGGSITSQDKSSKETYNDSSNLNILNNLDKKEKIIHKCSKCGADKSDFWTKTGKPVCENCYLSLEVNQI